MVGYLNLSAVPRLFDVTLTQERYTTGFVPSGFTNIPLVPCTFDHLNFNEKIVAINTNFPVTTALCPPLGQQLTIKGKPSSN